MSLPSRRMPSDWPEVRLDALCDVQAGPSGRAPQQARWAETDVSVINPASIQHGQLTEQGQTYLDRETAEDMYRYVLRPGDIVCTRIGDTRRHALVSEEHDGSLLGGACIRLRPDGRILATYLNHYLRLPSVQDWLSSRITSTVVPILTSAILRDLRLRLPPHDRQQAIAEALDALDQQVAAHREVVRTATRLRDSLAPALLTGAIELP
ncbi:Restriction modification system DNA specificity domain protein [Frankia canadensis]|uniref:Restriction modification system DNA specificity domain protein n=1 Tax=Frankia canadensis TaxID=1836972 RepID=A0A2I2KW16_9ACTN|nr:restriction endonuclease subunit S [Frankia canadensis]SNQ49867.1 Restriction modification system DNA specificity domain protein [Frankia canadensis]SOU57157.1 Restriction modification system DNA specificity domain protein [Frankia canadensis]